MDFDTLAATVGGAPATQTDLTRRFSGVSIDSRTIERDQLFVALYGENHDGHDYVHDALTKGAAGFLLQQDRASVLILPESQPVVTVPDTHQALIALAAWYRDHTVARRLAITGSNGKTTTKEFAYQLLSAVETHIYRSPGNLNNLYGLPLSLLAMPADTRYAVLELGISTPGEMERLAPIARPHVIAITNVGPTHLKFLGTVEGVAAAKLELVDAADESAPVIVNADDDVLMTAARRIREDLVTFGMDSTATYHPDNVSTSGHGHAEVTIEGHRFHLPLFGRHQVYNLLAAYAIARTAGISFDGIDTESIALSTAPMRGETIELHGVTVIADCYNANPESVQSAIDSLMSLAQSQRTIVVLGDMLELGGQSTQMHKAIGRHLAQLPFYRAALVGEMAEDIASGLIDAGVDRAAVRSFTTAGPCADYVRGLLCPGDLLFVKGSRGIGLEKVIERWRDEGGSN